MQVIVQRAPVFTLTPHVLYLRKIGETVVMQCDAVDGEGIEKPSISWHKVNIKQFILRNIIFFSFKFALFLKVNCVVFKLKLFLYHIYKKITI